MAAVAPNTHPSRIEAEVLRIQGLVQAGRFEAALPAADGLLAEVPENRDLLYLAAVSLRCLGRIDEALAALGRLEAFHPGYSRLFQERGHCHVARRAVEPAIGAFLHAVNLNHALPASWGALQILYKIAGQPANAAMAGGHVAALGGLPSDIVTAWSMFADGDIHLAENMVRNHLLRHGDDVEGMRLLARIGMKLGVLDDAELLLEAVLARAPGYQAARYDYARTLLDRHSHVRARRELETLLAADPRNRAYRTALATALVGLGEAQTGIELYRELLAETPHSAELHLSIGHALKTLGRRAAAIESYRAAAACRPDYGDAYWSLANLKTYGFEEHEIARMRAAEAAPATSLADRYHLCFALGKAREDAGRYGESFEFYARGNALKKTEIRYRPETIEANAAQQAAVCTTDFFAARRGVGAPDPSPIFIVGLPRSGSTLLEQILASHSRVEGTMELPEVLRIVNGLRGRETHGGPARYPEVLAQLEPAQFRRLGDEYLANTRVYRTGRPFFIDKMPNNFRHVGLIHLMLPNARIIDARRDAMACCFGNFKQLFAAGQEFTYGIEDIARYYRSYVQLMAHWDAVLPGTILRIRHEDVVADLEGSVRRLLGFCGLEFEAACLEFHRNDRSVRTASSEQVRRPIYTEGLDQWRHFEPWLGGLKAALGPLADPT